MVMLDLVPPAVVTLAFTLWGYLRQGGPLLNGSALYCYGTALFVAFPAIYMGLGLDRRSGSVDPPWLLVALSIAVASTCVVLLFCSAERPIGSFAPGGLAAVGQPPLIRPLPAFLTAAALLLVAVPLNRYNLSTGIPLPQALGALAIFVLTLATVDATAGVARVLLAGAVAASALLYYTQLFDSFGRLVLGSIVCGMVAIYALRRRSYLAKFVLLGGSAPALFLLAEQRTEYVYTTLNYQQNAGQGIASVVSPFESFARILIASWQGIIEPSWGSTLWATLVFWVPRAWWPGKPLGFGAEIVYITKPSNLSVAGFSDAATVFGEFVWNLGILALPVGMILLAMYLRWMDRLVVRAARDGKAGRVSAVRVLVLATLLAGIVNLVWGGTFTFITRAIGTLILLVLARFCFETIRFARRDTET